MKKEEATEIAREIALKWAFGKNLRLKAVGPILTDLITHALLTAVEAERERIIKIVENWDGDLHYTRSEIADAIRQEER